MVENERGGVLLRPVPAFPETDPDDVFGYLAYDGLPKTLAETNAGIVAEAVDLVDRGLDFADAPHLGSATHRDSLLTFDLDTALSPQKSSATASSGLIARIGEHSFTFRVTMV